MEAQRKHVGGEGFSQIVIYEEQLQEPSLKFSL